jgi:hypothetical protein
MYRANTPETKTASFKTAKIQNAYIQNAQFQKAQFVVSRLVLNIYDPSTAFGHSDRKKLALTGRHNFVTSIL